MLLKLVFRIKLSDPKQTVAIPTESRSQTRSLWNKSMWSYVKNQSRKESLEQAVARVSVNSLDVNSEEAEPGSQTQSEMSRFKKQMNFDRPDRLEAVQSDVSVLKEAMASQNASKREGESKVPI